MKTPFKSVSPKRPSAAEPAPRPVSVSPENKVNEEEEKKVYETDLIKLAAVTEAP